MRAHQAVWSRLQLPSTRARRRQVEAGRVDALRTFGTALGWQVLGLSEDLSEQYPVAPLIGAQSAQAELAVSGEWEGAAAVLGLVLVRQARRTARRSRDTVVQLTTLDTGHRLDEFAALVQQRGFDVALLSGRDTTTGHLNTSLLEASGSVALQAGDHLAATGARLLHTRTLHGTALDLEGPLRFLSSLAVALRGA